METFTRKGKGPSRKASQDVSLLVAETVLTALDCPRALTVLLLMQYGEWQQLVNLEWRATDYPDVSSAADAYQATALLSKANHLPTGIDQRAVAVRAFHASEEKCRMTNVRLKMFRNSPSMGNAFIRSVFHTAAHYISGVLGPLNPDSLIRGCGFGPGVSSSVKGKRTGSYDKALGKPEVTPDLTTLGAHVFNAHPPLSSALLRADGPASLLPSSLTKVRGNVVAFVPKNAKTFRSIAVEPHVNIFFQKGIGSCIRHRLKKVGIDLRSQQRNQRLAELASREGNLATVDLSAASDTIATELVRELLPPDWFTLLDMSRSKYGFIEGSWMRYEKFSSMGNGFTFELETLLFWALTRAVVDLKLGGGIVSVYGDDIICPAEIFPELIEVFTFAGFTTNSKKSFATGPFRESCGEDFYFGVPIRPFFIRGPIKTLTDRISIHNQIFRYALRRNVGFGRDSRFLPILKWLRGASKLLVPYDAGDIGFASSFEEASPRRAKFGQQGFLAEGLIQVPARVAMVEYYAALYSSFVGLSSGAPTLGYTPLRGVTKSRRITIHVSEWSATETFPIYFI